MKKLIAAAAWAAIGGLAYVTLTHVGLMYSIYLIVAPWVGYPSVKVLAAVEHVLAFAMLGGLFYLAYPNRILLSILVVCSVAVGLEYLQTLTPDRHGTVLDAGEKIAGGLMGILAIHGWNRYRKGWSNKSSKPH